MLRWTHSTYCLCTEGQVVHTLTEGEPVREWRPSRDDSRVAGVTSLGEEIYLLRPKAFDQVEVYDVISYRLLRCLTVPNSREPDAITSCQHFLCLYICDPDAKCVHRLDLQGSAAMWPVNDRPWDVSVNADHNLIVLCRKVRKIKEFSPRGDLLRDVTLPDDVINPLHAIQLANGQFIVCHGVFNRAIHRVCKISSDGRGIIHSHGGQPGSNIGQYNVPGHLALDDNDFLFVLDYYNRRVTLLSSTLDYIRQVVSRDQVKWEPYMLYYDIQRRRLYVVENDGKFSVGRVVVYSV